MYYKIDAYTIYVYQPKYQFCIQTNLQYPEFERIM